MRDLATELQLLAQRYGVDALKGELDILAIADFSKTLEREIEALVALKEPVWINPKTGRKASSIFAAFDALGFYTSKHWGQVCRAAQTFQSSTRAPICRLT